MAEQNEAATQVPAGERADVEVRPTVFVALGGTGMEVLLRLRRRILQADWAGTRINSLSEFPVARFLYFDTDTNEARESGRAAVSDPMTTAIAFGKGDTLQTKVNVGYYQKNKRNYPFIDEWLPSRDLSRIDTEKGAGQVRAISRLLFFDKFDAFRSAVAEKGRAVISNVSNARDLQRLGLKTQNQLRVVVVGSVAGGTGSGAFIDAGLAISSMVSPKAEQVDLFLVLPGGYIGANRDRVFANTFAALSELEHVMRPNPTPPYVKLWSSVERPEATKPFSDVYLFDTRNLNGDSTSHVSDVWDMMADILFEDFGNSEFAARKRSVAVNQQQHKMRMFHPPLSTDYGRHAISFSQGFSAVGQSTVATTGSLEFEAAVVDAGRTMLEAFFGVAAGHQRRLPSPEARDRFMADNLGLSRRSYDDFPSSLRSKPPAIPGYVLIDQLMQRADRSSSDARLLEDIDSGFQRIRESVNDPSDWVKEAASLRALRERDVSGTAGQKAGLKYGLRGEEVIEAKQRLFAALKSEEGDRSIKSKLYALLDDQEHAGLDYTIELIQQVKSRLTAEGEGIKAVLERAEDQFAKIADHILSEELADSMVRLERAGKKGLLGGVDRAAATKYLSQVQEDLKAALKFRLRSIAAKEARLLLEDVAGFMGDKLPAEEDGEPRWTGLAREFVDGHRSVEKVLDLIAADADRVRDAIRRPDGGAFIVIGGAGKSGFEVDRGAALDWARQAFQDFGGCRNLFVMLRTEAERLKVLNQLRSIAKAKLADVEERIPTAVDALRAMSPEERRKVLARMLARSMPWIHAEFDRFKPSGDQFKMIIAVADAREFQDEFGSDLLDLMPKGLGMSMPGVEESGVKGRILCYCELSGVPLDVLAPLRDDWRKSYDKELSARDPLPLHNHEDYLRFPNPVAPSTAELDVLRADLRVFLKGVAFGLLQRRSGPGAPYQIDMSVNDWQSVGAERTIRRKRFDLIHKARLEQLIAKFEDGLGPAQTLAIAALFDWTARRAYAPRLERTGYDQETRLPGLTNKVCVELAAEYLNKFGALRPTPKLGATLEEARERLLETLDDWTQPVPDSLDDVDSAEANRDAADSPEMRAENKRSINPKVFGEQALMSILNTNASSTAFPSPPPPPPPPPPPASSSRSISYYLVMDGATAGPFNLAKLQEMKADGRLTAHSQVYDQNANGPWREAASDPALSSLFSPPPPSPSA